MNRFLTALLASTALAFQTGCGTLTGIPAHGGGKRFSVEQKLVSASIRATLMSIDVSALKGERVVIIYDLISDEGGGNISGGRLNLLGQASLGTMVSPVVSSTSQFQVFDLVDSSSTFRNISTGATANTVAATSTFNVGTQSGIINTNGVTTGTSSTAGSNTSTTDSVGTSATTGTSNTDGTGTSSTDTTGTSSGSGTSIGNSDTGTTSTGAGSSTNTSTTNSTGSGSTTNTGANSGSGNSSSTSSGAVETTTVTGATTTTQTGTNTGSSSGSSNNSGTSSGSGTSSNTGTSTTNGSGSNSNNTATDSSTTQTGSSTSAGSTTGSGNGTSSTSSDTASTGTRNAENTETTNGANTSDTNQTGTSANTQTSTSDSTDNGGTDANSETNRTENSDSAANTTTNRQVLSDASGSTRKEKGSYSDAKATLQYRGLGDYQVLGIPKSDASLLMGLVRNYLMLSGVEVTTPSDPTATALLYVTVDVFGINRSRFDAYVYNRETVIAETGIEMFAFDRRGQEILMKPISANYMAEYDEKFLFWAGPFKSDQEVRKGEGLLVTFKDVDGSQPTYNANTLRSREYPDADHTPVE